MRALGKPLGLLVFALDAGKGAAPAWLGMRHGPWWALGAGTAAVLGHSFPVWLGFKGGKGVATGLGMWLAIAPLACLAAVGVWLLALQVTRYVAFASVAAAFSLPVAVKLLGGGNDLAMAAAAMAALVALRHRANFVRIAAGVEPRSGDP